MLYDPNVETDCLEFLASARGTCQKVIAAIAEFDAATDCDPIDTEIAAAFLREELAILAARLYRGPGVPLAPLPDDFYERAGETWRKFGSGGERTNGLDPAIWGELAAWGVMDPGRQLPTSEEAALALLARAADMVTDLAAGEMPLRETIRMWIDDTVTAAVTYGWFADSEEAGPGAEA